MGRMEGHEHSADGGTLARCGPPVVEVLYTHHRLVLWDDGAPGFGGYYARIAGFGDQGEGRTIEQALERLAAGLRVHVENWDAEVDEYAHAAAGTSTLSASRNRSS